MPSGSLGARTRNYQNLPALPEFVRRIAFQGSSTTSSGKETARSYGSFTLVVSLGFSFAISVLAPSHRLTKRVVPFNFESGPFGFL